MQKFSIAINLLAQYADQLESAGRHLDAQIIDHIIDGLTFSDYLAAKIFAFAYCGNLNTQVESKLSTLTEKEGERHGFTSENHRGNQASPP